ncbi:MAG: signal peptidase I [Lachnospiraceae bacterium]|jgi:signal peptidase I|nr:signal peptidase I [Lachnospiraceae bacterium]
MEFYREDGTNRVRGIVCWITDIIVVVAMACYTVYAFGNLVVVSGNSMSPLLNSEDIVLMNQLKLDLGKPERFDVVVFEREDQKRNIKRIIGLPGETVQIQDGQVLINGQVLEEKGITMEVDGEMVKAQKKIALAGLAENPVVLGADEYFLLGDNRDSSEDSRFANVGNVKESQIIGKVWFRIHPTLNMGIIR